MKKLAAGVLVLALGGAHALAGVVEFDLDLSSLPPFSNWMFDVTLVADDPGGFNSADVVIGSNEGLSVVGFEYSQEWLDAVTLAPSVPLPAGIYDSDLFVGGFSTDEIGPRILLGTVSVDSTGLADGNYVLLVSSAIDGGVSSLTQNGMSEGLEGATVVGPFNLPEPATVFLIGIATLGLLRSHRIRSIATHRTS